MQYFDLARINMVKNQIMPQTIRNNNVLETFENIPRHIFVGNELQSIAYSDARLQVAPTRYMLAPDVIARMIDVLELSSVQSNSIILDVQCGSGYSCAILSSLAEHVVGIESNALLINLANKNIELLEIGNVSLITPSPTSSLNDTYFASSLAYYPYDAIFIGGGLTHVPLALSKQLKVGGRLVYIKNITPHLSKAVLVKNYGSSIEETELFDTFCEPLII